MDLRRSAVLSIVLSAGCQFDASANVDLGSFTDASVAIECGSLSATIRDFRDSHPDMERIIASEPGLVEQRLGDDGKPRFGMPGAVTVESEMTFNQWYRDTATVNVSTTLPLTLAPVEGNLTLTDLEFFPIDAQGFGNEGRTHNFHFTTEIHALFDYTPGAFFNFRGDDDVFIFVNGQLTIDLGGVHGPEGGSIDFDAQAQQLDITPGGRYTLDIFHAERHTSMSTFSLETSIECLGTP